MKVYIGTSGWSYNHWRKVFYPEDLSKYKLFDFYCKNFNTVEINATFYRNFKEQTFKNWYKKSPENFLFSLKAPKTITHLKKLINIKEDLKNFIGICNNLKEKLGVILFQFPPSFRFDESKFEDFLLLLKNFPENKFTIEVRNKTFDNEKFFELMKKYQITLCFSDTGGRYSSLFEIDTGNFLYIRLHGPGKLYASKYSDEQLIMWKEKILGFKKDAFIYFDNDFYGYAPLNALKLIELFKI